MSTKTNIEWCHHTFNPWIGCTKVSAGCANCYAEALMDKRWGKVKWGPQGTRVRTSPNNWREPIKWNRAAAKAGERRQVFCASLADVFEGLPELDEWLVDLLLLIDETPHLDWLLLTKRPENIPKLLPTSFQKHPRNNVWLGISVEDQARADERIPHLLNCPAAVRFLSVEPLLGLVNLDAALYEGLDNVFRDIEAHAPHRPRTVDWVIVGGESGPDARPCYLSGVEQIVAQCEHAGVACFVKQLGSLPRECGALKSWPLKLKDKKGGDMEEWPHHLRVRQMPTARVIEQVSE